ncbi:MAG: hypothetical protein ORN98_04140, partial [Alphaproteobacteria bacterium]|nr:hypothetical protein [Alphaproteobacteria bacterium]
RREGRIELLRFFEQIARKKLAILGGVGFLKILSPTPPRNSNARNRSQRVSILPSKGRGGKVFLFG